MADASPAGRIVSGNRGIPATADVSSGRTMGDSIGAVRLTLTTFRRYADGAHLITRETIAGARSTCQRMPRPEWPGFERRMVPFARLG